MAGYSYFALFFDGFDFAWKLQAVQESESDPVCEVRPLNVANILQSQTLLLLINKQGRVVHTGDSFLSVHPGNGLRCC